MRARAGKAEPHGQARPLTIALHLVMVGLLVWFLVSLRLSPRHEGDHNVLLDGWVVNLVNLIGGVVGIRTWRERRGHDPDAAAWGWFGAGAAIWGVANVWFFVVYSTVPDPIPAGRPWILGHGAWLPSDAGYFATYVLFDIGLVSLMRGANRHAAPWLDAISVGLGLGAVAAASLLPVVLRSSVTLTPDRVMSVVYVISDVTLLVTLATALWLRGSGFGARAAVLAAGLGAYMTSDIVFTIQNANGTYVLGTILDGGWTIAAVLIVSAGLIPAGPDRRPQRPWMAALGSIGAGLAALVVLALGASERAVLPDVATALATACLLSVALRLFLSTKDAQQVAQLLVESRTDPLTGLGNRRALECLLSDSTTAEDHGALILIDLDRFKEVNDSLGHAAGDELLAHIGPLIVNATIGTGATAVRLGGDEFAVYCPLLAADQAVTFAHMIIGLVEQDLPVAGTVVSIGASAGVALWPEHARRDLDLLRLADVAMYEAKRLRTSVSVFVSGADAPAARRLRTASGLRRALHHDEFRTWFQPKVDMQTGDVRGFEALVRWQHPTLGLLAPAEFLDVAEDTGLAGHITEVVLEHALSACARWRVLGGEVEVAINLAEANLRGRATPSLIADALRRHGLPPSALGVELTEGTLVSEPAEARRTLTALRELGVRVALDDYGTGWSSLAYVRDFPIDELKLDRSFVAGMTTDSASWTIVRSTIDLAHALGMTCVAEGVADEPTRQALVEMGCDQGQGYLWCPPRPAHQLDRWIKGRAPMPIPEATPLPGQLVRGSADLEVIARLGA